MRLVRTLLLVILIVLLSGCAVQNQKNSAEVSQPTDVTEEYIVPGVEKVDNVSRPDKVKEMEQSEGESEDNKPKDSDENDIAKETTPQSNEKINESTEATSTESTFGAPTPTESVATEATLETVELSGITAYESFNAMSGEAQVEFMESFDSIEAFFTWYNAAKAEYEALHPDIEISDGIIDVGAMVGGNG